VAWSLLIAFFFFSDPSCLRKTFKLARLFARRAARAKPFPPVSPNVPLSVRFLEYEDCPYFFPCWCPFLPKDEGKLFSILRAFALFCLTDEAVSFSLTLTAEHGKCRTPQDPCALKLSVILFFLQV